MGVVGGEQADLLSRLLDDPAQVLGGVRGRAQLAPYVLAGSERQVAESLLGAPEGVEGGRNPLKRFEASMAETPERAKARFYCDNFVDLMGAGLSL